MMTKPVSDSAAPLMVVLACLAGSCGSVPQPGPTGMCLDDFVGKKTTECLAENYAPSLMTLNPGRAFDDFFVEPIGLTYQAQGSGGDSLFTVSTRDVSLGNSWHPL